MILYLLIFFTITSIAFFPPLSYILSVIGLFFCGLSENKKYSSSLAYVFLITATITMAIYNVSIPNLLEKSDDFVTYYNNYLDFLNHGFSLDYFVFGGGFEIGLPILNYILSIVIGEPMPYLVKLSHTIIILILYLFLIFKIIRYYKLSNKNACILIAMMFVFFKLPLAFYFLRQGYSSLFILIGVFSLSKKKRYFSWCLSLLFHLSSVILIPLICFLLLNKDHRKIKLYIYSISVFSILLFSQISLFNIPITGNLFLDKLVFFINIMKKNDIVEIALRNNLSTIIYFIPLVFILVCKKISNNRNIDGFENVLAIFVTSIAFMYIPGVSSRILMAILTFNLGFIYFYYGYYLNNIKSVILVTISIMIFLQINWMTNDYRYYYRYPIYSETPFYYVNSLSEVSLGKYRYLLPSSFIPPTVRGE